MLTKGLHAAGLTTDEDLAESERLLVIPPITPATLHSFRERENLSQARLAEVLGVTTQTVSRWERGASSPEGPARKLLDLALSKGLAQIVLADEHEQDSSRRVS